MMAHQMALQGGFAKCYQFISLNTGTECAGKVVAKTSLQKERTKQKVCHQAVQVVRPASLTAFARSFWPKSGSIVHCNTNT
jgi:hypothetical protein